MTIAIAYGVDICIEGNITINCIQEKRSGIKSNSLNTAASSVSGSLHVVCSFCNIVHHSPPSAF